MTDKAELQRLATVETEAFLPKMFFRRAANRLGRPFGVNPFPRAFENSLVDQAESARELFDVIHRKNFWGSEESRSGVGSEREFTNRYRLGLSAALNQYEVNRMFDAPCGDLNWMSDLLAESDIEYVGGDISQEVITNAQSRFPQLNLRVFDITADTFPNADVWHCRDCLFHLPFKSIRSALRNFVSSEIPYALITSHRAQFLHRNLEVGHGGFRFLDLQRAPFFLPTPISRIADYKKGSDFPRFVCLWTRQQISVSLALFPLKSEEYVNDRREG